MKYYETSKFLKSKIDITPKVGLVLGSGLGDLISNIKEPQFIKYDTIPGFPISTVSGHAGQFVFGYLENVPIVAMQGRVHFYEGYSLSDVVLPIRTICLLGLETLILTNASGGINLDFEPGDLMMITDHINTIGNNPLFGPNDDNIGTRFPDMSKPYSPKINTIIKTAARNLNIDLKEGVYAMMSGPSYETPAEIKMLRILGADAVGMSTVPENIAANHMGIEVAGISCITNMASGVLDKPLTHEEVHKTGQEAKDKFLKLLSEIFKNL